MNKFFKISFCTLLSITSIINTSWRDKELGGGSSQAFYVNDKKFYVQTSYVSNTFSNKDLQDCFASCIEKNLPSNLVVHVIKAQKDLSRTPGLITNSAFFLKDTYIQKSFGIDKKNLPKIILNIVKQIEGDITEQNMLMAECDNKLKIDSEKENN